MIEARLACPSRPFVAHSVRVASYLCQTRGAMCEAAATRCRRAAVARAGWAGWALGRVVSRSRPALRQPPCRPGLVVLRAQLAECNGWAWSTQGGAVVTRRARRPQSSKCTGAYRTMRRPPGARPAPVACGAHRLQTGRRLCDSTARHADAVRDRGDESRVARRCSMPLP